MAGVKKKDIPNEAEMFVMLWELTKDFWIPEDTDEYYRQFNERANEIVNKTHSELGKYLIITLSEYFDKKFTAQSGEIRELKEGERNEKSTKCNAPG